MQVRTIRTIYNRPPTYRCGKIDKKRVNTVSMMTNELHQLENERKMVEQKISSVEKKIQDIQKDINSISDTLEETKEYLSHKGMPMRIKHITIEY